MDEQTIAPEAEGRETLRVLTVRIERNVYEQFKNAAHRKRQSMNQLAVDLLKAEIANLDTPTDSTT